MLRSQPTRTISSPCGSAPYSGQDRTRLTTYLTQTMRLKWVPFAATATTSNTLQLVRLSKPDLPTLWSILKWRCPLLISVRSHPLTWDYPFRRRREAFPVGRVSTFSPRQFFFLACVANTGLVMMMGSTAPLITAWDHLQSRTPEDSSTMSTTTAIRIYRSPNLTPRVMPALLQVRMSFYLIKAEWWRERSLTWVFRTLGWKVLQQGVHSSGEKVLENEGSSSNESSPVCLSSGCRFIWYQVGLKSIGVFLANTVLFVWSGISVLSMVHSLWILFF